MKATIYGLIDPNTHQVRYVGRTIQTAALRWHHHIGEARRGKNTHEVYNWIRSLRPALPVLVILQEGVDVIQMGSRGWNTAQAAETKWMKRLERSRQILRIEPPTHRHHRRMNVLHMQR